ncbi:hypothetical protein ACFQJC_11340 [Haloferax namakaokahaiae]|uniref:Rod shape-determining protein MreD n=1 Tax=Haloferax namakaokahaiae TaxID=1748331 RepID=A0ABD5ZGA5_9EURY
MNVRRSPFLRDSAAAIAVLVGLYALAFVQFQPVQIPGYLLMVGFGVIDTLAGPITANYDLWFGVYLVALGLGAGAFAGLLRTASRRADLPAWRVAVAGAAAVVGVLSLLFALGVLFTSTQVTPVLITATTAVFFFALAAWLAGLFSVEMRPTR